jgi:hypothetical protein
VWGRAHTRTHMHIRAYTRTYKHKHTFKPVCRPAKCRQASHDRRKCTFSPLAVAKWLASTRDCAPRRHALR